jgi:hypothetical protein
MLVDPLVLENMTTHLNLPSSSHFTSISLNTAVYVFEPELATLINVDRFLNSSPTELLTNRFTGLGTFGGENSATVSKCPLPVTLSICQEILLACTVSSDSTVYWHRNCIGWNPSLAWRLDSVETLPAAHPIWLKILVILINFNVYIALTSTCTFKYSTP